MNIHNVIKRMCDGVTS